MLSYSISSILENTNGNLFAGAGIGLEGASPLTLQLTLRPVGWTEQESSRRTPKVTNDQISHRFQLKLLCTTEISVNNQLGICLVNRIIIIHVVVDKINRRCLLNCSHNWIGGLDLFLNNHQCDDRKWHKPFKWIQLEIPIYLVDCYRWIKIHSTHRDIL